jgi:uncharacterized repeat protein (TIGR01451 family)
MRFLLSLLFVLSFNLLYSQTDINIEKIAAMHLLENQKKWSLTDEDVSNFNISSYHTSKQSGVTHIYVNQNINGISIQNAIAVINVKADNSLLLASSDFIPDAKSKVSNKKSASLSPQEAIRKYCDHHHLELDQTSFKKKNIPTTVANEFIFNKTSFSEDNLYATLLYFPTDDDKLALTWRIEINEKRSPDFWVSYVDAHTGDIIHSDNQTKSCQFHQHSFSNQHTGDCTHQEHKAYQHRQQNESAATVDGSSYLVYSLPLENPLEGEQTILNEPFLPEASPFGWHDLDGVEGAEFTVTRGNNAHAFQNTSGSGNSEGDEPDGGASLNFNFQHDKLGEPIENVESDVTQLFYITNWMHDFSYFFGFDEVAGNFQENNYGRNGSGGDNVISRAIENQMEDGSPVTNNARFSSPRDGQNGTMFMFPWVATGNTELNLLSPVERSYEHGGAAFGIPDQTTIVSGQVVISLDSGGVSELNACDSIINAAELAGNVALVERGECDFSFKVNNLQNAGAIAVLVCNRDEEIVTMAAGENADLVTIPSSFLRKSDCDTLKAILDQNMEATLQFVFNLPVPAQVSGSFDNGITVHEYGHGISIRLAGGRNTSNCLNSEEQMGEGWSDFFTLVATQKSTDRGEDAKAIGTYVTDRTNNVVGIRRVPYSTDFSINAQTYNDIRFTGFGPVVTDGRRRGEHEVGEIWASVLWDMYWEFIDTYGYNEDWTDRTSGNSRAIQLVFDGLKLQRCNPGLVDGRDAILAADEALFSGENQCMIWDVFARRGIGFDAVQGSSDDREDNQEGFLTAPACQDQLVITKTATDVIRVGDPIDIELIIENNTLTALTNVVVSDVVPEGTSPIALDEFTAQFNESTGEVTFDVSEMQPLDVIRINYQLATSTERLSILNESVDNDIENFTPSSIAGDEVWNLIEDPVEGNVWNIAGELGSFYDQVLEFGSTIAVTGDKPSVLFNHNYEMELFFAAGDVEISTNNGGEWISVNRDQFITSGYNDDVIFKNNDEFGFTGESDGTVQTAIDLTDYVGQNILLRFRFTSFVTDGVAALTQAKDGWTISAFEVIDLVGYDLNEACVTSDQLNTECDGASTIIESDDRSSSNDILKEEFGFKLYPNPATNLVQLSIQDIDVQRSTIRLSRIDGSLISSEPLTNFGRSGNFTIPLPSVPNGLYIMEVHSPKVRISEKLSIIQ